MDAEVQPLTRTDLPEILHRYRNGESLTELAKEAHVNRSTIYRWMLAGLDGPAHQQLITECLVERICQADEQLETAADACNIARAREIARFARFDLERRRPQLYGPKHESKQDTSVKVIVYGPNQSIDITPPPVVLEAVEPDEPAQT